MSLAESSWLDGPVGNTRAIGKDFFEDYARDHGLDVVRDGPRGLLRDFHDLKGAENDPSVVAASVADFYETTSLYELDAWSEWNGLFKPFGAALA